MGAGTMPGTTVAQDDAPVTKVDPMASQSSSGVSSTGMPATQPNTPSVGGMGMSTVSEEPTAPEKPVAPMGMGTTEPEPASPMGTSTMGNTPVSGPASSMSGSSTLGTASEPMTTADEPVSQVGADTTMPATGDSSPIASTGDTNTAGTENSTPGLGGVSDNTKVTG